MAVTVDDVDEMNIAAVVFDGTTLGIESMVVITVEAGDSTPAVAKVEDAVK